MRLNPTILTALAMVAASGTASAAIVTDLGSAGVPWTDNVFGTRFRNFKSTTPGGYEIAVGESSALGGAPKRTADATWSETALVPFSINFNGATRVISVSSGGGSIVEDLDENPVPYIDPNRFLGLNTMRIDVKDGVNGDAWFEDVELNGVQLGTGDFVYQGTDHNNWIIKGFDFSGDWTLTGNLRIDLSTSANSERPALEVNVGVTPVPEPSTYVAGALLSLPLVAGGIRKLRQSRSNVV